MGSMMNLKKYLDGRNISQWCRENGITPEAISQYLSGKREYLGIEVASQVFKATGGEVPFESLVRPQVAKAVNSLIIDASTLQRTSRG